METSNRDWTVSRSYRLWEQWEVDQLVSMWREGATSRQIANMIGRTPAQVRSFVKNNPMTFEKVKEEVYYHEELEQYMKSFWTMLLVYGMVVVLSIMIRSMYEMPQL